MGYRVKRAESGCAYETCFARWLFEAGIAPPLLPQKWLFQTTHCKIVSEPITLRSRRSVLEKILNYVRRVFVVG